MVCPACHYTAYPAHYAGGDRWGDQWRQIAHYPLPHRLSLQCPDRGLYGDRRDHGGNRAKRSDRRSRLQVKNIRYYKSQPWGTANDILLGFYCDVDGDDRITMDPEELKYAEWVQREDIVLQPGEFSLTNEMMKRFKEN